MRLGDLLQDIPVLEMHVSADLEIRDICYDSRACLPGDLFVAVVGYESDGHRFIPMALEKGAVAVVCQTPLENTPYIQVPDSRRALALLSRRYFAAPGDDMCVIGVTGTNGKTTTTLLLKHVLERCQHAKVGLMGTTGNRIGDKQLYSERTTPESYEVQKLLAQMKAEGCTHVVMEVSSHALVLNRVEGLPFHIGIFTNLTQDHLDFHGTMEHYADAKALLFSHSDIAVLNTDDPWSSHMASSATGQVCTFGLGPGASCSARDIALAPDHIQFTCQSGDTAVPVQLAIPGRFSVYNALGVLTAAQALGIPLADAADALRTAHGVAGRMESVPTDSDFTILIDYAHTPDALENVLRTLRETGDGRIIALFGCGGDRDRTKRPIMGRIGAELSDYAIITSDNPRTEDPLAIIDDIVAGIRDAGIAEDRYTVIPDRVEAIGYAIKNHLPGDVILLAGKGHETYQEIHHVRHHMDEREIVHDALAALT